MHVFEARTLHLNAIFCVIKQGHHLSALSALRLDKVIAHLWLFMEHFLLERLKDDQIYQFLVIKFNIIFLTDAVGEH